MLSGQHDTVIPPSEMAELWKVAKMRPKQHSVREWFRSALGRKDDEENTTKPENDVFEQFLFGSHSAYRIQLSLEIPFLIDEFLRSFQMTPVYILGIGTQFPSFWITLSPLDSTIMIPHRCDNRRL
jgi:hypothetical protein